MPCLDLCQCVVGHGEGTRRREPDWGSGKFKRGSKNDDVRLLINHFTNASMGGLASLISRKSQHLRPSALLVFRFQVVSRRLCESRTDSRRRPEAGITRRIRNESDLLGKCVDINLFSSLHIWFYRLIKNS